MHLQLWDTAGQEQFRSLTPAYIRSSEFAIIVYAVDSRDSFSEVEYWVSMIRQEWPVGHSKQNIMIVGNKSDLAESRQVNIEEGEAKAKKLGTKLEKNVDFLWGWE